MPGYHPTEEGRDNVHCRAVALMLGLSGCTSKFPTVQFDVKTSLPTGIKFRVHGTGLMRVDEQKFTLKSGWSATVFDSLLQCGQAIHQPGKRVIDCLRYQFTE